MPRPNFGVELSITGSLYQRGTKTMNGFSIILNLSRKNSELTPADWSLLRETIKIAVSYDEKDQSFRLN
jgi:hypothetical protein